MGGRRRQRRPVTILFADLVGSTAMAERLGPDDWSEILGRVHAGLGRIVEANGGNVAQILGDGLLAIFGTPHTHEDDPLRAVQAALEMIDAVRALRAEAPLDSRGLAVRVGIDTGIVVLGEVASATHTEHLALGDPVNVAARIQALADPMTVLISGETERLVAGSVETRDAGEHELKGRAGRVHTFEVLGLRAVPGRHRGLAPNPASFVGRDTEVSRLLSLSSLLSAGTGGVVIVTGEPGIGKSRLLAEWRKRASAGKARAADAPTSRAAVGEPAGSIAWVEVHCLAQDQERAYRVIGDLARDLGRLAESAQRSVSPEGFRSEVTLLVGDHAAEALPYLCQLLSLPLEPGEAASLAQLDARALQVHLERAVRTLLIATAERRPLALVVEDIHWIDPSSAELLARLLPLTADRSILVCLTSRPGPGAGGATLLSAIGEAAWADAPAIALPPLSPDETVELLENLLPGTDVGRETRGLVLGRAEGNPLFVEEIVRALLDGGHLARAPSTRKARTTAGPDAIPLTLHGLLLSRIGTLPEDAHAVLRIAAVIGRRFRVSTLVELAASTAGLRPRAVLRALERLVASGVVQAADQAADLGYVFRHALVADAAYDEIVRSERAGLHLAVARTIERDESHRLDELAPDLARHFRLAGDTPRAVAYLERAARRAAGHFANAEAMILLEEALELAAGEEDAGEQDRLAGLHELLGDIHHRAGQQDAAVRSYEQACAARSPADLISRARAERKAGQAMSHASRLSDAPGHLDDAERLLESAGSERTQDWWQEWIELQIARLLVCYWAGAPEIVDVLDRLDGPISRWGTAAQRSEFFGGRFMLDLRASRYRLNPHQVATARQALEAAEESGDLHILVAAQFQYGFANLAARALDDAERDFEATVRVAERIAEPVWECRARSYLTFIARLRRDPEEVRRRLERQVPLAEATGLTEYLSLALTSRSWLALVEGNDEEAERLARSSLDQLRALEANPFEWLSLWPLLAVQLRRGDVSAGVESARQLLRPPQQILASPVTEALEAALAAWEAGEADLARVRLEDAHEAGIAAGYL